MTAEPVFTTTRNLPRADSNFALQIGRQIALMCDDNAGRIELLIAAIHGNANAAARISRLPPDLGAVEVF
jgi:hypothetical protein